MFPVLQLPMPVHSSLLSVLLLGSEARAPEPRLGDRSASWLGLIVARAFSLTVALFHVPFPRGPTRASARV